MAKRSFGPVGIIDIGSNSIRFVAYAGSERVPSNLFNEKGQSQAAYTYFSTGTGTDGYADYYLIRPRIYSLSVKVGF